VCFIKVAVPAGSIQGNVAWADKVLRRDACSASTRLPAGEFRGTIGRLLPAGRRVFVFYY
jgi:hypothetical protein